MFQAQTWPSDCIGYCHPPCLPVPCLKGSTPTGFWDGCWDEYPSWYHHLWQAWWHQGSLTPTTSLLATPWVTHCCRYLCSVEKPSSSLHHKRRRSLVLYTNHTKASPKHSCLPVVVFSGLVSTRSLRKLFGNVKHAWDFKPRMLLHHSHQHLHLHIPGRYVHCTSSHWMLCITSSLLISIPR